MKTAIFIIVTTLSFLAACENDTKQPYKASEFPKRLYVQPTAGVYIREHPSVAAPVAILAPFAADMEAMGYASDEEVIAGISGRWLKVTYGGKTGYAFSAFMATTQPEVLVRQQDSPDGSLSYTISVKASPNSPLSTKQQADECQSEYTAPFCTLRVYDRARRLIRTVPGTAQGWRGNEIWSETYLMDAGTASSTITLLEPISGHARAIYFGTSYEGFEPNEAHTRHYLRECISNFCIVQEENRDVLVQVCRAEIGENADCSTVTTIPSYGAFATVTGKPTIDAHNMSSALTLIVGKAVFSVTTQSGKITVQGN